MARVVVPDACVLYSAALRDLLLRCGEAGLLSLRWSDRILDEMVHALARTRPDIPPDRLIRLKALMVEAFPNAMVEPSCVTAANLPDRDDEHVLAVAVATSADVLVTLNLSDFPQDLCRRVTSASVLSPDRFLLELLREDLEGVQSAVNAAVRALRNPPMSVEEYLSKLGRQLPGFLSELSRER